MTAGRTSDIDVDWVAKRDARIIRLWNDGMSSSALATRFTLTQGGVQAIILRERNAGKTVRQGQRQWA
jgi:hypothetical protein